MRHIMTAAAFALALAPAAAPAQQNHGRGAQTPLYGQSRQSTDSQALTALVGVLIAGAVIHELTKDKKKKPKPAAAPNPAPKPASGPKHHAGQDEPPSDRRYDRRYGRNQRLPGLCEGYYRTRYDNDARYYDADCLWDVMPEPWRLPDSCETALPNGSPIYEPACLSAHGWRRGR